MILSPLVITLASCSGGDLDWPGVKRQISEDYPEVTQLSVDDYQKDISHGSYLVDWPPWVEVLLQTPLRNLRTESEIAS